MKANAPEQKVYALLDALGIAYEKIEHPAVYTCEEAARYESPAVTAPAKNLLLTNGGKSSFFLIIMAASKKLNAKALGRALGEKGLTFASPEDMLRLLGLMPGAVSPFGLINDEAAEVAVILDREISTSGTVSFHPNVNTASVILKAEDFLTVMRRFKNKLVMLDF